ncbi:MAG: aldehyde dehydrogenase family protein, partial [Ramlibacter sp.]|nr:aldehyde dehydrogenase family protein [Ramlibacter sp.]
MNKPVQLMEEAVQPMWIGGQWVQARSGASFTTINPATGATLGRVPLSDAADVDAAVRAARGAFPEWSRKTQGERSKVLLRFAALIREEAEAIAQLECAEHGTPIEDARHLVQWTIEIVEYTASASRALMGSHIPTRSDVVSYLQRVPVGVCALITPWNVPFIMMAVKMAAALGVGNTCVMKPPSINSLTGLKFAGIVARLPLPAGAVNVITGPGSSVGTCLASHPDVDLIGFTGSTETGRAIMAAASPTIKKLVMELGGKNPFLILQDADVERAAKLLAFRQFNNAGQHCSSPGRYYVHESIHDEFVAKLVEAARQVVVGDPADPGTGMGPLVSAQHRLHVERCIRSGVEQGATVVFGGGQPAGAAFQNGFFLEPTVMTGVRHEMEVAREEIFGPVACVLKFDDEREVIELANDSVYGLCAGVFSRDV